jgi:hypothetical protein
MDSPLSPDRLPWRVSGMEVLDAKGDFVASVEDAGIARIIAEVPQLLAIAGQLGELLVRLNIR